MSEVPIAFAFTAGVLAVLNPCAFALLPVYGAYYVVREDGDEQGDALARIGRGLKFGLFATLGFVLLFGTTGALVAVGISAATDAAPYLSLVAAVLLLVVGARLLLGRSLRVPGLSRTPSLAQGSGAKSMFSFGVLYGIVSLTCTLPVFLLVVGTATAQESFAGGLVLFFVYALAMGLVLTFVTTSAAFVKGSYIKRFIPYVSRASGLALMAAGIYLINRVLTVGLPGIDFKTLDTSLGVLIGVGAAVSIIGVMAISSRLTRPRTFS